MRIEYRWEALDQENSEIELSKQLGKPFVPNRFENEDTPKQLLARSRYLLFKRKELWSPPQIHRAEILSRLYHRFKQAYDIAQQLGHIYQTVKDKGIGYQTSQMI